MDSGYPRTVMAPPRRRGTSTCPGGGTMGSPTLTSTWNGMRARQVTDEPDAHPGILLLVPDDFGSGAARVENQTVVLVDGRDVTDQSPELSDQGSPRGRTTPAAHRWIDHQPWPSSVCQGRRRRPGYYGLADSQQRRQSHPQRCFGLGELAGEADQLAGLGTRRAQPSAQRLVPQLVTFGSPHSERVDDVARGVIEADADGSVQGQQFPANVESGRREVVPTGKCISGRDSRSARQCDVGGNRDGIGKPMAGQRGLQTQSGPGRFDGDGNEVGVGGRGACLPVQAATDCCDAPADTDLIAIAVKAPRATLCLETALARHGLSDAIPAAPDVALPRGTRIPATDALARWHHFAPATFDIGRELLALDGAISIGLYDAPRSIIDAFRMRATEGHELGYEALRRWLRASGSQPGQLIRLAGQFPKAETPLRMALAALL